MKNTKLKRIREIGLNRPFNSGKMICFQISTILGYYWILFKFWSIVAFSTMEQEIAFKDEISMKFEKIIILFWNYVQVDLEFLSRINHNQCAVDDADVFGITNIKYDQFYKTNVNCIARSLGNVPRNSYRKVFIEFSSHTVWLTPFDLGFG